VTTIQSSTKPARSCLNGILSAIIPGLGQMISGYIGRGLWIIFSIFTLSGLTVYTAAQRARFPDYQISAQIFITLVLESVALLIFLIAIYYIINRFLEKEEIARRVTQFILVLIAIIVFGLVFDPIYRMAEPLGGEKQVYELTIYLGAMIIACLWLWNISNAIQTSKKQSPSLMVFILLSILGILVVGSQITQINLPKAIREYKDTQVILQRILWPWEAAFDYEASDLRAEAQVQAPCPDPLEGLQPAQPGETETWIIAEPACGEVSTRDSKGNLTLGTKITISGVGFEPGEIAIVEWKNPIGNAFTPRGVGDTKIMVEEDGTFISELHIPDTVIPSTAVGPQYHTLSVYQRGVSQFTGDLSKEMNLALQAMLETIMMGLMATFAGIVISIPFSFLAARNLMQPIRSSLLGFIGNIYGLFLGGWAGIYIGSKITPMVGGLEGAPVLTAVIYLILILGLGIFAFRLVGVLLESLTKKFPVTLSHLISILGLVIIGLAVGFFLGHAYAHGIINITRGESVAILLAPTTAKIGAVIFGVLFGVMGIKIGPNGQVPTGQIIYFVVRTILNIVRSIEPLIWALVGVIWIGPGPFSGFIALTIHSVAALGKLYSEAIESINPGPIEALQATGANRLQTIVYAVIPQVLPPFISFTIYRWDINVRMSTVIGLVGGGGIGFLLIQWIRQFQYDAAGIAVWLIAITVAILDYVSAEIREKFV
jgi:phosphonate ABC transporter permease subunit PhnE